MRRSKLKTTVAVLRDVIGLGQKEFAALVNRSTATIQSLELGRLKLGGDLASLIARETGVNLAWLMDGKVEAPIVAYDGRPYTCATYGEQQALGIRLSVVEAGCCGVWFLNMRYAMAALAAQKADKLSLFWWKVSSAVEDIAKEFGRPSFGEDIENLQESFPELWSVTVAKQTPSDPTVWEMQADCIRVVQELPRLLGGVMPPKPGGKRKAKVKGANKKPPVSAGASGAGGSA